MTFLIIVPYKIITEEFPVDNIYDSSINNTYKLKFLLEVLECCTQIKAYGMNLQN